MIEREKILRFFRGMGDQELASRIVDFAEATLKNRRYQVTDFLDPHGFSIAESAAATEPRLQLISFGGYEGAERVKAAFVDEHFPGEVDFSITAVEAKWDGRYYSLSQRDVMGALLSLGIKRGMFGDTIMVDSGCQIVVDQTMLPILLSNFVRIGAANIVVNSLGLQQLQRKEETFKEVRATVASLRIDSVAAAGFGTSRTQMAEEISADKVKINWKETKNSSQAVKTGDIISLRGRGRIEVMEITGLTKKGRTGVLLKRYI